MDLVSRRIIGIIRVTIWVIGVTSILTKSPDPPSGTVLSKQKASTCRRAISTGNSYTSDRGYTRVLWIR